MYLDTLGLGKKGKSVADPANARLYVGSKVPRYRKRRRPIKEKAVITGCVRHGAFSVRPSKRRIVERANDDAYL